MTVRAATSADAAAVAGLEEECLGADAWSPGLVDELVDGTLPTVHAVVVEHGGLVVGYAAVSAVADVAELQRIAVSPRHRRQGVGAELLEAVLHLARRAAAQRLLLEVRESNVGARRFYADSRFVEIATRPRYYRDGASALVLERDVPQV